jgi:hypothetical protein
MLLFAGVGKWFSLLAHLALTSAEQIIKPREYRSADQRVYKAPDQANNAAQRTDAVAAVNMAIKKTSPVLPSNAIIHQVRTKRPMPQTNAHVSAKALTFSFIFALLF